MVRLIAKSNGRRNLEEKDLMADCNNSDLNNGLGGGGVSLSETFSCERKIPINLIFLSLKKRFYIVIKKRLIVLTPS